MAVNPTTLGAPLAVSALGASGVPAAGAAFDIFNLARDASNQPGKNAPPPPDYMGLAQQQADAQQQLLQQQTQANRPDQSTPFATATWTTGPDGRQTQSTNFNGPLAGLNSSLQQQAADAMSSPFSLDGLPGLTDGASARQQAIDAAYGDATSRLNPQWQQRENDTRSRLLGQGLAEGSEAYNNAMASLGRERNDAYTSAMNSAIGQGTSAGSALFNQSLAARNQKLAEALRQRGQAFGELQSLQGFTAMPGFMGAGQGSAPNLLGAAGMQDAANWRQTEDQRQRVMDMIGGGADIAGFLASLAPLLASDERAKADVVRLAEEAIPGVPLAQWRYRPEYGDPSVVYEGVIAQDLQRVAPEHVYTRPDGLLMVSAAGPFAPRAL